MPIAITSAEAQRLITHLLNSPIAPGTYSHFLNVGTDHILDSLEENYFRGQLADGIGTFKYLEGDYGSGKTQFILSLAQRAAQSDVVTSVVNIGAECPFNSQLSIFRAVVGSFLPPDDGQQAGYDNRGIELLIQHWIVRQLRNLGVQPGGDVPAMARDHVQRKFDGLWMGPPDVQMASGLKWLGLRLLEIECGAAPSVTDQDLIQWVRGENVRSRTLWDTYGLHEPAKDQNAFGRLKTIVGFLRTRMGYRGFFIAFDEGTRTASFRRGSAKQKQAIENMLSMINENMEGQFGGVMFLYAATPDFKSDVIQKYTALNDRIGTVAFSPGSPMVPLIDLEAHNSDAVTRQIGTRLIEIFSAAYDLSWDLELQQENMDRLISAQKDVLFLLDKVPPRVFVYQYCRFLSREKGAQRRLSDDEARSFVADNELPEYEEEA
jgi:hypothetical protein